MELLITLLKLISTTLAGAFGVLALLVEYRDKNGDVSKWGKVALWGVTISAVVSFSTQIAEHLNAEISAQHASIKVKEQFERSDKILTHLVELERASQPLDKMEFTIVLKIPNDFIHGESFLASLRKLGKELRDNKVGFHSSRSLEYFIDSVDQNGIATSFEISRHSSLFPKKTAAPELYSLVAQTGVELSFIANESAFDDVKRFLQSDNRRPSLGYFGKHGDYAFGIDSEDVKIQYDIEDDEMTLWIEGSPEERFIRKSGEIVSYPDFNESYMLLSVDYVTVPSLGGGDYTDLQSNRKSLAPRTILLSTSGRNYTIRQFGETKNVSGYKTFSAGPIDKFLK